MKNVQFTLLAFLSVVIIACANEIPSHEVPSVVKNAILVKYPKAVDLEWEWKKDLYEVEFEENGFEHEAWIDTTGNILKVKKDISANLLPDYILKSISMEFGSDRIDDVEEISIQDKNYYLVELQKKLGEHKVVYNSTGGKEDISVLYSIK